MNSKTSNLNKSNQIMITLEPGLKKIAQQKAKESGLKTATYLRACLTQYFRQQGENI